MSAEMCQRPQSGVSSRSLKVYGFLAGCLLAGATGAAEDAPSESVVVSPAEAQGEEGDDSTVIYSGEFFDQYNPNTANDMLPWIPGISLALDGGGNGGGNGGGRGLGGGENILINGQRMSGKSNSASDQLSRIPASEVERIEIIRGSAGEFGVRSAGQIINIVLTGSLNRSSITAEVNTDLDQGGRASPGGSFSYSRQQNNLSYLLSLTAEPRFERRRNFETSINADSSPNDTIYREEETDQDNLEFAANLTYDLTPRDRLQFNAQIDDTDPPQDIERIITDLDQGASKQTFERERIGFSRESWEFGGDYERVFADNSRLRALFISTREEQDRLRSRFVRDSLEDDEIKDLVLNTGSVSKERIFRSSFTWNINDNHDLEIGTEISENILESRLAQGLLTAEGPSLPETGGLPSLEVPNANTEVEENRYEPFAVHNWQMTPRMNLQSELTAEFSKIKQSGDTNKSRTFDFLRPSFELRYDLTPSTQLRLRIQRLISQLDLVDFVATSDPRDDERDTEVGNPGLSQEKTWRYEANYEYRFANDLGVINAQAFYEDIESAMDRIDLTPLAPQPTGVNGNIGNAEKYGLELTTSTRLDFLNLQGAIFTTSLRLEDSSVTDPILGTNRRLQGSSRGGGSFGFRHDISALALNYGVDYDYSFNGGNLRFDTNRIESFSRDPNMSLFVQKTAFNGIIFRLESRNTLVNGRCRVRQRFASRISDPRPVEVEKSCSNTGQQLTLKIRATF